MYIEAEMSKQKIEELKEKQTKYLHQMTENSQLQEKVEIEEAYLNEFNEFNNKWTQKLQEFEDKLE